VRALGVAKTKAEDQARDVARAFSLTLRLDVASVALAGLLVSPERKRAERFEHETERALGLPFPAPLAGVVPRLSETDAPRLVGSLLAASDRRSLVERFDEDWFRNPRAAAAIREEDAVLGVAHASEASLQQALAEIV